VPLARERAGRAAVTVFRRTSGVYGPTRRRPKLRREGVPRAGCQAREMLL